MEYYIDNKCLHILSTLEERGYKAYLVGGCVRDMVMGRIPHDLDITTEALPEQVMEIFSDCKVIPTGLKHGTVTVIYDHEHFEITTFRIDGTYTDSRRPDSVTFTKNVEDDLARRDFTMNAIALDKNGILVDPFGGREDIENRLIRCVGDPTERFSEDALRILRAVRFASVLGFDIEENTSNALLSLRKRLDDISAERVREELVKLIKGGNAVDVMLRYRDIIGQIIPELIPAFDFQQYTKYHKYDVYEHTVRALASVPKEHPRNELLRVTMLLHDVAKPVVFHMDSSGKGHFKGHGPVGAEIAANVLKRLKFDNDTIFAVHELIAYHSEKMRCERDVKRLLMLLGQELFFLLIDVKKCDNNGKCEFVLKENEGFEKNAHTARLMLENDCCLSVKQLAVNGRELEEMGIRGKNIGECLRALLELVIDGKIENEKNTLIETALEMSE